MFARRRPPYQAVFRPHGVRRKGSRYEVAVPPRRQPHGTVVRLHDPGHGRPAGRRGSPSRHPTRAYGNGSRLPRTPCRRPAVKLLPLLTPPTHLT
ncbi:hypothetical protein, partial [Streptomyces durocortorensis]